MVSCTRSSASWGLFVMRKAVRYRLSSCASTPASTSSSTVLLLLLSAEGASNSDSPSSCSAAVTVSWVSAGSTTFACSRVDGDTCTSSNGGCSGITYFTPLPRYPSGYHRKYSQYILLAMGMKVPPDYVRINRYNGERM